MIDCRYFEPATINEAGALLAEHSQGAKVVAGGQSLALLLRRGEIKPSCLISLQHVAGLDSINAVEDSVVIGARVTLQRLESEGTTFPTIRALSEAAQAVGDRQVRSRGTLGGSICEAHPASDITAVLMTLNATVKLVSADGVRGVNLRDFVVDAFTTAIQPGELLTEVIVPRFVSSRSSAVYHRFALRAGDFPAVSIGVFISLDDGGQCHEARVVVGNCLGAPIHAREAEQRMSGSNVVEDDGLLDFAASIAAVNVAPLRESMVSSEYKRELVGVLTREALTEAVAQATAADP